MALEARAVAELSLLSAAAPTLALAPRGDGHPVLVLPGLLGTDGSTLALRAFLKSKGYDVYGWQQGRNLGLLSGVEDTMLDQVSRIHARTGRKVSLVGWSLGGIYARMIAKLMPDHIRSVITLGSPFACSPRSTSVWHMVAKLTGEEPVEVEHRAGRLDAPLAVPATSIFSRTDGVCAWQGCIAPVGPCAENIEVEASHCGLGHHPAVLFAVADRLAQLEGQWTPFHRRGWRSLAYPDPARPDRSAGEAAMMGPKAVQFARRSPVASDNGRTRPAREMRGFERAA